MVKTVKRRFLATAALIVATNDRRSAPEPLVGVLEPGVALIESTWEVPLVTTIGPMHAAEYGTHRPERPAAVTASPYEHIEGAPAHPISHGRADDMRRLRRWAIVGIVATLGVGLAPAGATVAGADRAGVPIDVEDTAPTGGPVSGPPAVLQAAADVPPAADPAPAGSELTWPSPRAGADTSAPPVGDLPVDLTTLALPALGTNEPGTARQAGGPASLVRPIQQVLPALRHLPVGTTIERLRGGSDERCPGVAYDEPPADAAVTRSFVLPGYENLLVQGVAYQHPRRAQRALEAWFTGNVRDCRRYTIDDLTIVTRRTRPPVLRLGNDVRAIRMRITYHDPVLGPIHAGERVVTVYRHRRYLLVSSSTQTIRFLGDTPRPNFQRWAASVEFMFDRTDLLPR